MSSYNSEAPVLDTYQAVVSAYSDFLTVTIHTILYERDIYPSNSFIKARKYDFPVRQNRHPKVCKWIQDAVAAVEVEMLKCTVARTSLIIHAPPPSSSPLERYVFSTASFPRIPESEILTPFATGQNTEATASDPQSKVNEDSNSRASPSKNPHPKDVKRYQPPPVSNLPEQFRATLARLLPSLSRLRPLPADCTFTLAIELRDEDEVDAPLRPGEQSDAWIAADLGLQKQRNKSQVGVNEDPSRQTTFSGRQQWGKDLGGVRTTPVRSLEAGAFAMEMWVEEGKGKFSATVEDSSGEKQSAG